MKYEVVRHTICGDREIEDMDYFDSKNEAEAIANMLTKTYKEDDGHPWSGDKFYVRELTEEVVESRMYSIAMQRAYAEMYMQSAFDRVQIRYVEK